MVQNYQEFLNRKSQLVRESGFAPIWLPDFLFDFQRSLCDWSIRKGRAAIFADCGLGKTAMQLVWAENVVRQTSRPVLILTPLSVSNKTAREAEKFGIQANVSRDGKVMPNITITNYERLHHFRSEDFSGVVCDESSILKSFSGMTRKRITRFTCKMPYRLLCTATAAPNDFVELGTSAESLGELSYSDMLRRFFAMLDDKGQKKEKKLQEEAEQVIEHDSNYYGKLAYRVAQTIGQWRLKHHAVIPFWRWVASWSRACRMPSDLGFDDGEFVLPPLNETDHVIKVTTAPPGMLFHVPAFGLAEERSERRRTLTERCDYVSSLLSPKNHAIIWCHMNIEGNLLEKIIPDSVQVSGADSNDWKEAAIGWFCGDVDRGELESLSSGTKLSAWKHRNSVYGKATDRRVLITKPKIASYGLNLQHCNHVVTFASHSYEQYYQSVRRCWRFGQKKPVNLDVVATEGEVRVLQNMRSKARRADTMFTELVKAMNNATRINRSNIYTNPMEVPLWL